MAAGSQKPNSMRNLSPTLCLPGRLLEIDKEPWQGEIDKPQESDAHTAGFRKACSPQPR